MAIALSRTDFKLYFIPNAFLSYGLKLNVHVLGDTLIGLVGIKC